MFNIKQEFKQISSKSIKDDYKILEKLGTGATSTVKKCKHRQSGECFAVKIFKRSAMDNYQVYCALREASVLSTISHANVL